LSGAGIDAVIGGGARGVALRAAEPCECRTYCDVGNENQGFVHIYYLWFCLMLSSFLPAIGLIFICAVGRFKIDNAWSIAGSAASQEERDEQKENSFHRFHGRWTSD
jgi:hypothetical protein